MGKKDVYNEHTEHAQEHVQQFIQIGPPRNLTVMPTSTGDEFVVSWLPPEHGLDSLRVYIVRWYREPGHYLHGSSETRENYYKGIFFNFLLYFTDFIILWMININLSLMF